MRNILIIEDDTSLRMLLDKILGRNYNVTVANNGMDALCWMIDGNYPDLIITDMMMPSMDGMELLENVRVNGLFQDIPVIILSGSDDPDKKEKTNALGVNAYLMKPFKPKLLLDTVQNVLEPKTTQYYA